MHKCVRCGATYADNDESILRGCITCGSIFFLFLKEPEDVVQAEEIQRQLEERNTTFEQELSRQIEIKKKEVAVPKYVQRKKAEKIVRVIEKGKFGIETVRIPREGVYEINIEGLMEKRPLIILEKGKVYLVHLPSVFERYKR